MSETSVQLIPLAEGRFLSAMSASIPESSLQSLRTKHVATFFGSLERCSRVLVRAACVWDFGDRLDGVTARSQSYVQCPFRLQTSHSMFALSASARCRRFFNDEHDGRTGNLL